MSRTCDGLLAVNVMSAAAARKCFQAGVRGSHCAGLGAGAAHGPSGWSGRSQAVISFDRQAVFSQGRGGSVLRRAQSNAAKAAQGGLLGGKGAVCARAVFAGLFAILRWGRPKVIFALLPKRVLGIPLGCPRAVRFSSRSGPASPPMPAEALRVPLGLG